MGGVLGALMDVGYGSVMARSSADRCSLLDTCPFHPDPFPTQTIVISNFKGKHNLPRESGGYAE